MKQCNSHFVGWWGCSGSPFFFAQGFVNCGCILCAHAKNFDFGFGCHRTAPRKTQFSSFSRVFRRGFSSNMPLLRHVITLGIVTLWHLNCCFGYGCYATTDSYVIVLLMLRRCQKAKRRLRILCLLSQFGDCGIVRMIVLLFCFGLVVVLIRYCCSIVLALL